MLDFHAAGARRPRQPDAPKLPALAVALLAIVSTASPALAGPLTFEAALVRARANAPSLQAGALGVDASRASRRAAGALPDPKLTLGVDGFPISGPNAFKPSREDFAAIRVGVSQDIPNPAKRRALRSRADAEIAVASAEAVREARNIDVGAALAWIGLAYAEKRVAALDEARVRLNHLVRTTPSAVAAGAARPAQTLAGRQALAALDDKRDELLAAANRARADLTRWTGDTAPVTIGTLPVFAVHRATLLSAIDTNPSLAPAYARAGLADAAVRLAEAERRPDFGAELVYQRRDPRFGDLVSAGVTISLPFVWRDRQKALIAASQAEAGKVRAEQDVARRELESKLEADLADHAMHDEQWKRSRDTLEPLARQRVDLETASYGAGRATLIDVVDAHIALVNAALSTLDREALVAIDGAKLTLTYRGAAR